MSCRETPAGKAICAYATASGIPSAHIPRLLHAAIGDARAGMAGHDTPADPEMVRAYLTGLRTATMTAPGLTDLRRRRLKVRLDAALADLDTGNTPDQATFYGWRRLPVAWDTYQAIVDAGFPTDPATAAANGPRTGRSRTADRPYHKRFRRFSTEVLDATDALFTARPSRLAPDERDRAFRHWVEAASAAYDMKTPTMRWDPNADDAGGGYYIAGDHSITLSPNRPSITTLIHEFRHALQHQRKGAPMVDPDVEVDARAWSLSLYHQVRPELFARLVREGRILHIRPEDLD